MAKGPLGAPRPLARDQLEINFKDEEIEYVIRGPLGVKRRFAKPNPGVTDEEVAICMRGESANNFIQGIIEDAPFQPSSPREAQRWMEDYCRGTLESLKAEANQQVIPLPPDMEEAYERAIEEGIDFTGQRQPEDIEALPEE